MGLKRIAVVAAVVAVVSILIFAATIGFKTRVDDVNDITDVDADTDNDGIPNQDDADIDGDGADNDVDTDDDGDGVPDDDDDAPEIPGGDENDDGIPDMLEPTKFALFIPGCVLALVKDPLTGVVSFTVTVNPLHATVGDYVVPTDGIVYTWDQFRPAFTWPGDTDIKVSYRFEGVILSTFGTSLVYADAAGTVMNHTFAALWHGAPVAKTMAPGKYICSEPTGRCLLWEPGKYKASFMVVVTVNGITQNFEFAPCYFDV